MQRRHFIHHLAGGIALPAAAAATTAGAATRPGSNDELAYASVADLQAQMQAGSLNVLSLARACIARIEAIDRNGPTLRSVIELNPEALDLAAALDAERRDRGPRGPLHGIPVLLKDNVATADAMQTTAGSLALVGAKAPRDAHLVTRLRAAGALILGKTNLSEWANIRSTRSTSGWSARGGLTRNPHALDRNTSGSSSGSGAAVAAGLVPLAVGTETDGSIVSPASINGLVGFKPTLGLVSRDGIVPISHSQDTAGPMTRSVADAALLLSAMAGPDPRDAASGKAPLRVDYARHLDVDGLKGARLQVFRVLRRHALRFSAVVRDKTALLGEVRTRRAAEPGYRYKADGHELYDAMLGRLFARVGRFGTTRHVMFAVRGSKPRTQALEAALKAADAAFEHDFGFAPHGPTTVDCSYPWKSAGLQACDYLLWALQRFYERGEERFLTAMWPQFVEVLDLDLEAPKQRGQARQTGVVFNEEHPLTLASRAGVVEKGPGDIG